MRNGLLDYGRLIGAIGIVWFHTTGPGYRLAYAALPFFLVLLVLGSRSSVPDRARRLLLPFVIWSAIYGIQRLSDALQQGVTPFGWWKPSMLLMGTSDHLWFLPFAFLTALAAPPLRKSKVAVVLPVLAAMALALIGQVQVFPWYQWSFGLIPALVGFSYVQLRYLAVLPLIASYAVLEMFRPSPDNFTILLGSGLAIMALSITIPSTRLSAWSARVSIYVYLGHMMAVSQFKSYGLTGYPLIFFSVIGSILLAVGIDTVMQRRGQSNS